MKIKQLTTSVALATLLGSGSVMAVGDAENSLQFGGYFITNKIWMDMEADVSSYGLDAGNWVVTERFNDTDESTNKNFDDFNLWMSKQLDENFNMYAEIDADGRSDDLNLEQAWLETNYFGNWATVRIGQQRLDVDGDHKRRVYNDIALSDTSILATILGGGLNVSDIISTTNGADFIPSSFSIPSFAFDDNMLGVNIRGTDGNAYYSLGIYDDPAGGITERTRRNVINGAVVPDSDRESFEREVSHLVTLRGAYKFGEKDDDWQFQGAATYFNAEGTESEDTQITTNVPANNTTTIRDDDETTSDGFNVELYGSWSSVNMIAEFTYFDGEIEVDSNNSTVDTNPASSTQTLGSDTWEIDGISFILAWASDGAYEMEAGGAPILVLPAGNQIVYDVYFRYWDYTAEVDELSRGFTDGTLTSVNRSTHENEWDGFAIGGTAYFGQYVSAGLEYGMGDYTFSDSDDQVLPVDADGPLPNTKVDKETDYIELELQVRF